MTERGFNKVYLRCPACGHDKGDLDLFLDHFWCPRCGLTEDTAQRQKRLATAAPRKPPHRAPDLTSRGWMLLADLMGYASFALFCASFVIPGAPAWYWAFAPAALFVVVATFMPLMRLVTAQLRVTHTKLHIFWRNHHSWAFILVLSHTVCVVSWLSYVFLTRQPAWLLLMCVASTSSVLTFTYVIFSEYRASR